MNDQITTLLPEVEPTAEVDYDWAIEQFYALLARGAVGLSGKASLRRIHHRCHPARDGTGGGPEGFGVSRRRGANLAAARACLE